MTNPTFLQIHTLTSYPGTLLNRDDAGFAKRLPFGGVSRTRVSSQCLKRHWRTFEGQNSISELDQATSIRSRITFTKLIANPIIGNGNPTNLTNHITGKFIEILTSKSTKALSPKEIIKPVQKSLNTDQIIVLGKPEVQYIYNVINNLITDMKGDFKHLWEAPEEELTQSDLKQIGEVLKALFTPEFKASFTSIDMAAGFDAALFGRMVTGDILARGDAAIHVAHAITVHEEANESDYFSAIDDLLFDDENELGSAHINSTELTSGLFYGYVVIDLPLLVSNLTGCDRKAWLTVDRDLAAQVVERIIQLIATVTPGAKLGSTAPYSNAQCVLIEAGNAQPRTLANAFQRPVVQVPDVLENTYQALAKHIRDFDGMYGKTNQRTLSAMGDAAGLADSVGVTKTISVPEAAAWAANLVRG